MPDLSDLFRLSPDRKLTVDMVGGKFPVVLVDRFYEHPDEIRAAALTLPFRKPTLWRYPGKLAPIPANPSLRDAVACVAHLANSEFLPRAPIRHQGNLISSLRVTDTDFAIVDMHPDELEPEYRRPHIDPVPVFGLVYLNHEDRGGTLFFQITRDVEGEAGPGYFTEGDEYFRLVGRIEPKFNRLAIYPGFVYHSGEIAGDWIEGQERFTRPRLTQRFIFIP
jgi:hypothetical protein